MQKFFDIHSVDPYLGFDHTKYKHNVFGWHGDNPFIQNLVREVKPSLIIEVGTWLGQSAIHMGRVVKELKLDTKIICVDTWLGSFEHLVWLQNENTKLYLINGYPSLYYHFLANVVYEGLQDVIVPFPIPSSIAAKYFKAKAVAAQLIYLDGSHDEEDVLKDMNDYWPLLEKNGILFGDDLDCWISVQKAVERFEQHVGSKPGVKDYFWWFRK